MKVPPKRKGNSGNDSQDGMNSQALNESPSEKEGKSCCLEWFAVRIPPSMKVPPKRKGNAARRKGDTLKFLALNESPSEKEGKYTQAKTTDLVTNPQ